MTILERGLLRTVGFGVLMLLCLGCGEQARASQDVVHFGESIDVAQSQTIHDAVCFFCSVNVEGTVNGDIVAFFGHVHIRGQANHDVVNFFGGVQVADDSAIRHDLVNFFGGVRLGENVNVGQDMVVMFGNVRKASTATIGGDQVTEPAGLFWGPVSLIVLGVWFVMRELRGQRRRRLLRGY